VSITTYFLLSHSHYCSQQASVVSFIILVCTEENPEYKLSPELQTLCRLYFLLQLWDVCITPMQVSVQCPNIKIYNRFLEITFAKRYWLLSWAHKLTKSRRKSCFPASILHVFFAESHPLSPWISELQNWHLYDKGPQLFPRNSKASQNSLWNGDDYLMMVRLHPGVGVIISWETDCSSS
jgi:hypothetical protein